jgi:hypothetical protein
MKRKNLLALVAFIAVAAFVTACSTMKAEPEKVKTVKRVAVIGYSLQQEMPPSLMGAFLDTAMHKTDNGMHAMGAAQESPHANVIYTNLADTLQKRMHWKVIDLATVTANPDYAQIFHDETTGFHNRPPAGKRDVTYGIAGLMDGWQGWRIDQAQKQKLIADLGVDAIAVASVHVTLNAGGGLKKLVGAADLYPQATLEFYVYDGKSEDPIWHDLWAQGEEATQSTAYVLGVTNTNQLNESVVESTNSAFGKLIQRIHDTGVAVD